MEKGMREPHAEGGSDSTVTPSDGLAAREGRSQAFAGVRAGQLLSREILIDRGADVVVDTEGNIATELAPDGDALLEQETRAGQAGSGEALGDLAATLQLEHSAILAAGLPQGQTCDHRAHHNRQAAEHRDQRVSEVR